ncbi:MAG: hypothetical protein HQL27_08350, partial [Candidatus Omnitrophica bacterium]|nr:hypothetical protein [Candidatus Omnitrophota bacterium]
MPDTDDKIKKSVSLINLGCSRNLVDSQAILSPILEKGYKLVSGTNTLDMIDAETVLAFFA